MEYSISYVRYEAQKRLNLIRSYRLHSCCSHLANEFEYMSNFIFSSQKNMKIIEYTNAVYYGGVYNGVENGYGILIYENGEFYMGQFRNSKRNGECFNICTNGDIYKGIYENNSLNGAGCMYSRNINVETDGIFTNGRLTKVNTASDSFTYEFQGKKKMIYEKNTGSYKEEASGCGGIIFLAIIVFIIFKCCS